LYPIRVKDFTEFAAVNYDKWDICDPACSLGQELEVPVYKFVKEALIRKFGEDWYMELEKVAQEKLSACQAVGEKLKGQLIEIHQKAGVDGRLFGSVTNHDISDSLVQKGFTIEKGAVRLPNGPLKAVGEYPIAIALHTDVVVDVMVKVIGEQA